MASQKMIHIKRGCCNLPYNFPSDETSPAESSLIDLMGASPPMHKWTDPGDLHQDAC